MRRATLLLIPLLVASCSSVQSIWYGCDSDTWHGWEYQRECARLNGGH